LHTNADHPIRKPLTSRHFFNIGCPYRFAQERAAEEGQLAPVLALIGFQ